MAGRDDYETKARIVVEELFPQLTPIAKEALAWLVADTLLSLDAIAVSMPSE